MSRDRGIAMHARSLWCFQKQYVAHCTNFNAQLILRQFSGSRRTRGRDASGRPTTELNYNKYRGHRSSWRYLAMESLRLEASTTSFCCRDIYVGCRGNFPHFTVSKRCVHVTVRTFYLREGVVFEKVLADLGPLVFNARCLIGRKCKHALQDHVD